jgi:hypothetical protein
MAALGTNPGGAAARTGVQQAALDAVEYGAQPAMIGVYAIVLFTTEPDAKNEREAGGDKEGECGIGRHAESRKGEAGSEKEKARGCRKRPDRDAAGGDCGWWAHACRTDANPTPAYPQWQTRRAAR